MFELDKIYAIKMTEGKAISEYGWCQVKRVELPLIEVTGMRTGTEWKSGTTIVNTSSTAFVSAERVSDKTVAEAKKAESSFPDA